MNWDVIIIGGGPAGATVASILLRHRPESRVLVLERADFAPQRVLRDAKEAIEPPTAA